jgi:transcriptional regulator of NAD metabolism
MDFVEGGIKNLEYKKMSKNIDVVTLHELSSAAYIIREALLVCMTSYILSTTRETIADNVLIYSPSRETVADKLRSQNEYESMIQTAQ